MLLPLKQFEKKFKSNIIAGYKYTMNIYTFVCKVQIFSSVTQSVDTLQIFQVISPNL